MTTMADLLRTALAHDPGRPLLTWYDEGTGERVELSATTYANWVAKVGSLLVEEHDLARGDVVLVDLPAHWLGPVFLGAAWTAGLVVAFPEPDPDPDTDPDTDGASRPAPDAVVCGPATVSTWADHAEDLPVLACSLLPMGVRFADPLPAGVHDVGVDVWSQPDAWVPWDPATPADVAVLLPQGPVGQDEMWRAAAAGNLITDGGRLLTGANPASPPGLATLTQPLARGGSLVLVSGASPARRDAIATAERVSHQAG